MNENLTERFGRRKNAFWRDEANSPEAARLPMRINHSIRRYFKDGDKLRERSDHWSSLPEIPSADEVWSSNDGEDDTPPLELQENMVVGPWQSKDEYLECHYRLLREDALSPLRDAVGEVQRYPALLEKDSECDAYIYERVFITGFTLARTGVAARLVFSTKRLGKRVNWEQSKRLRTGTLLALTPATDNFKTVCRIALVAARPLHGLQQNPPEIDVFFGDAEEFEIDPQEEWLMVESRNGYFEGRRHTLQSLQHLHTEEFPLAEHLVGLDREIQAPLYIEEQPTKDLRHIFPEEGGDELQVNILGEWPKLPSTLDDSQLEALKRVLTKRLAIVQGPPGTGKTFLSVMALDLMLQNSSSSEPPIIVTAQTNHALDQLLRHISKFEPEFVRLGAWTKDFVIVKPRTLHEIKTNVKPGKLHGGLGDPAMAKMKRLGAEILELLAPLTRGEEVHAAALFRQHRLITEPQLQSLIKGAKTWVSKQDLTNETAIWLGDERIEAHRILPEDFGFQEIEEDELDIEQLKEVEAESKIIDDENYETLKGRRAVLMEPWTGRVSPSVDSKVVQEELTKRDFWKIPRENRGAVYNHLQRLLKDLIRKEVRKKIQEYANAARDAQIGRLEVDYNYLRDCRVIGVTTTGLSKYRALLQSLQPKVVFIEEAAETLEGLASIACLPSLQQLVLVGDHLQLRGSPSDQGLAGAPFFLDVSLLERMVRNHVEFTQLNVQRRMIPEIRRILKPIYADLKDHPSVNKRAPIPGMGGINSFFFTHTAVESTDDQMSKMNDEEASMVCNFFVYLTRNGILPSNITVITCYQGQRKLIFKRLRKQAVLKGHRLAVETVDSYQGEENDIVLLSLVRSNYFNKIGFLANENRTCVALSRAQRGFYIFGNAASLCKSSMLWWYVVQQMAKNPCRIGFHLPLTCSNHGNATFIQSAGELASMKDGGCLRRCSEKLDCGHICQLYCHPFPHGEVACQKRCNKELPCGHKCLQTCSADCICNNCYLADNGIQGGLPVSGVQSVHGSKASSSSNQKTRSTQAFRDYANGGHIEADRAFDMFAEGQSTVKPENQPDLPPSSSKVRDAAEAQRAFDLFVEQQSGTKDHSEQPTEEGAPVQKYLDPTVIAALSQFDLDPPAVSEGHNGVTNGEAASEDMSSNSARALTKDTRILKTRIDGKGAVRALYKETYVPQAQAPTDPVEMKENENERAGKNKSTDKKAKHLLDL